MMKTFAHLFTGPAVSQKDSIANEETGGVAEDASTAPGSGSEDASEGSDMSTEEPPLSHGFDGVPACGAGQTGIGDERVQDRRDNAELPEAPVCTQAAPDRVCAEDGPAHEAQTKRAPPSRLPPARRDRSAKQKYAQSPDGSYSKTCAVCDWDYDASGELKRFASVEALLDHERTCQVRRQRGEHPAKYETLSAESQALVHAMNACSEEQHEATRTEIHASKNEIIQELRNLSLGNASGTADGADRLTVFELVHGNLKCDEVRALLAGKGIHCHGRTKAALAKAAAVSLEVRDVQAFLADEGGVRTSSAAASKKRPHDGTIQTTLPGKRSRVQTPQADCTAAWCPARDLCIG